MKMKELEQKMEAQMRVSQDCCAILPVITASAARILPGETFHMTYTLNVNHKFR